MSEIKKNQPTEAQATAQATDEVETCSGCKSYCPLTNPTCGVGEATAIAKGIPHKPVSAGKKKPKVVTDYSVTTPDEESRFVADKIEKPTQYWH